MQDFGSSAEDSQVSQPEPELRDNQLITTHVPPGVFSTDDDDKFDPLQELQISEPQVVAPPQLPQTAEAEAEKEVDAEKEVAPTNEVLDVPTTTAEDWENILDCGSFPERKTW